MKKLKFILFVLSFSIITLTCSKNDNPISSDDDIYEIEKYRAYSDIINSEFNEKICILDTTASGYWIQNYEPSFLPDSIQSFFLDLELETIESYALLNQTRTKVIDKFNISLEYSLISYNSNFDFSDPSIQIIDLTNIAFNELYSQAILYFGCMQVHGGYGRFLFLEKVENTWTIKNVKYMWALK
jgi:hypothetical protein